MNGNRAVVLALLGGAVLATTPARADDKACMSAASKGQELRDEGKLGEAKALFQRCAERTCPAPIPGYCSGWLADVNKKMPSIVFRAVDEGGRDVTDATAQIDDKPEVPVDGRAIEIDPGKHKVRIAHAGSKPFEDVLVVAQGEKDRVVVAKLATSAPIAAPAPAPVAPPETSPKKCSGPVASWVAWSVSGVALLSFAGFGRKARLDFDDYQARCGSRCTTSERDDVATSVTIADVSLVVGIVAAGVGTALWLFQPKAAEVRR
jgi:hypothetical protein